VADGELKKPALPLIPGHEVIGIVAAVGSKVTNIKPGDLAGMAWLGFTCGHCRYCLRKQENLCENALFTGYTINGGFADYTVAHKDFCFHLPLQFIDPAKAPLLCAGLIGYRSYLMTGENVNNLGIYGFGAAAHILVQVANQQGKKVYAFTRDNNTEAQHFAIKMGAVWAGNASEPSPVVLDAAIIFAPAGELVPKALKDTDKGGTVVCGGIHMSDIPGFPYDILWGERTLRSVANLTRKDGTDFLNLLSDIRINTEVQYFSLEEANEAMDALRNGKLSGAAVILPS
jgi:propanol-preferring alcohol dehydrogenase